MAWSQTGRILLVWPQRGRILKRRLDLILLQRQAAALGAQLALVTGSGGVRFQADRLGVPVFADLLEAQSAHWRTSRRRRPRLRRRAPRPDFEALKTEIHPPLPAWQLHPATRLVPMLVSLLALVALAVYLLPGATLTLQPAVRDQSVSLPVRAAASIQSVNLAGELPARLVNVVVEGRDSVAAQGTASIGLQPAIGGIQFTNLTEHAVLVPQGSVISTLGEQPVRFYTLRSGSVPAGTGRSFTISAQAVRPGSSGNLPAGSLIAIEGVLGLSLTATNPSPTHAGEDGEVPAPSAADRRALYQQLLADLRQTALADLADSLPAGDLLLTPTLLLAQVVEETYTPGQGEPAPRLELLLRLAFTAQAVSQADLAALAGPVLDASLPDGYLPVPGSLAVTSLTPPQLSPDGAVSLSLRLERRIQADIPAAQAVNLAAGYSTAEAAQRLEAALPLQAAPAIQTRPAWWPRLPFFPARIQVLSQP